MHHGRRSPSGWRWFGDVAKIPDNAAIARWYGCRNRSDGTAYRACLGAITIASITGWVVIVALIDQPTTRLEEEVDDGKRASSPV